MISLETPRLYLRRWRPEDVLQLTAINQDPKVMEFYPALGNEADSLQLIERQNKSLDANGYCMWAAQLKSSGELVGFVGLQHANFLPTPPSADCIELGYRIASRYWGQGLALEGSRASFEFARARGIRELCAICVRENHKSRRVMEKLGMTYQVGKDFEHPKMTAPHLKWQILYKISL